MMGRYLGPLHAATLDLHHAVEQTVVGGAMSDGDPTDLWYMGWCAMKAAMYDAIRTHLLPASDRHDEYQADIAELAIPPRLPVAIKDHVAWMGAEGLTRSEHERRITGTIYVIVGGNLMGGAVIAKSLRTDLPRASLGYSDRPSEMAYLNQLRHRADCVEAARVCFQALLDACVEIEGWK